LIVKKGNPKGIKTIFDLARGDVTFVNRQKGSGTRVLLDYFLEKNSVKKNKINGYDTEVFTHGHLATLVKSGRVDVGLGIKSAAILFDLDFIHLFDEEYDLIVLEEFYRDWRFKIILDIISSKEFQKSARKFSGYDLSETGRVIG
jgi:putative molybdopterin biosynthesis protein